MASNEGIYMVCRLLNAGAEVEFGKDKASVWRAVFEVLPDVLLKHTAVELLRSDSNPRSITAGVVYQRAMKTCMRQYGWPQPGEAWGQVLSVVTKKMRRVDLPRPVQLAAGRIGWSALFDLRTADVATRSRFLQFYEEALQECEPEILQALKDNKIPLHELTDEQMENALDRSCWQRFSFEPFDVL